MAVSSCISAIASIPKNRRTLVIARRQPAAQFNQEVAARISAAYTRQIQPGTGGLFSTPVRLLQSLRATAPAVTTVPRLPPARRGLLQGPLLSHRTLPDHARTDLDRPESRSTL